MLLLSAELDDIRNSLPQSSIKFVEREIFVTNNELDILLAALSTGVATGFKDTATTAVRDAYGGFKALLLRKFAGKQKCETILAEYEADPDTYEKPLRKVIAEQQLDGDQEIIAAAKQVLMLTQQQAASGQFIVNNQGTIQAFNQGIYNSPVTQNFGESAKDR